MLNKKVIAVALTCAISAGAIGITAGALNNSQSDSTAVSSASSNAQQSKTDSEKDKQNDKNVTVKQTKTENGSTNYTVEADSDDFEESEIELTDDEVIEDVVDLSDDDVETSSEFMTDSELTLTPEQEKQLEEISAEQEKITQNHADLWEKVYAAENEYLNDFFDTKDVVEDKDADDTLKTYHVITKQDAENDDEQTYTYYVSDEAENQEVVMIENGFPDEETDDFQEMVISKMDNITEEERKILLDDLKKLNELSDKALAIYEQAEAN